MTLKKLKIIAVISIFLFTVLYHFLYDWLPNPIFSIFFPVNESIWEHMKLLYSGIISWGLIEYLILNKKNIKYNNFWYQLFITAITSIPLYLILFLPLYNIFGENMIISIGLLIIVIVLEQILSYYLLQNKAKKPILNKISIILLILFYFVFLSFTYFPPENYIFYDTVTNSYGLK